MRFLLLVTCARVFPAWNGYRLLGRLAGYLSFFSPFCFCFCCRRVSLCVWLFVFLFCSLIWLFFNFLSIWGPAYLQVCFQEIQPLRPRTWCPRMLTPKYFTNGTLPGSNLVMMTTFCDDEKQLIFICLFVFYSFVCLFVFPFFLYFVLFVV